jgi:anti-sigma factor RsiW
MKPNDIDLLLRHLDGELTSEETMALQSRLAGSPELRRELEQLRGTRRLVASTVETAARRGTRPLLAERVLGRLASPELPEEEFFGFLSGFFRPIALTACLLLLGLILYNANLSRQYVVTGNAAESVMGLPPVNSTTIYDLDMQSKSRAN